MPVDIDRFETADDLRDPPTSKRIVRFLFANPEQAYTRREIADAVDADPETVGTNLTRLKERGLVRHREPYWAATDDREDAIATLRARYDDAFAESLFEFDADSPLTTHGDESTTDTREHDVPTPDAPGSASGGDSDPISTPFERRQPQHRAAATAFVERVRDRIADEIAELYLFGSVARGTATADSDVDVLAVIADEADYAAVDEHLLDIAYDIQLEYGVRVEVHSLGASEFAARKARDDPFVRAVLDTGESHA